MAQPGMVWLQKVHLAADRPARVQAFTGLAEAIGESPATLAIDWCLRTPAVSSVILGASRVEQLEHSLIALEVVARVDPAVWERVESLFAGGA